MKHIYLNLKRFDIPAEYDGINNLASIDQWAECIISSTQEVLKEIAIQNIEYTMFFPEAHLLSAMKAKKADSPIIIGCQSVFREDTVKNGNIGAFTTNRTAKAVKAMGCESTLIGHCEERKDKAGILAEANITDTYAVNRLLNKEIKMAQEAGLKVLYCVGESAEEQERWEVVLKEQLEVGLKGIDKENVVIGYEPVWAIGPGKVPPGKEYITKIVRYIKEITGGLEVVYGGGLKADNAKMLSEIRELDGGLIGLTRFQGDIGYYPEEYLEIIRLYANL